MEAPGADRLLSGWLQTSVACNLIARDRQRAANSGRSPTWFAYGQADIEYCQSLSRREGRDVRASVFVGTSVDGFIARRNGDFDFLPEGGGEPHGYEEFLASVDVLVIGRHTYEKVLTFDSWPYAGKRVIVLSSRPLHLAKVGGAVLEQMSGTPAEITERLSGSGTQHAYVDGGITVQRFIRAGLIQRIIVTRVPVLIGDGIPLFGSLPADVLLRHVLTTTYPSGLVKSEYEVLT